MRPPVTLLTDFGLADPYVAEVKAALLREWSRYPAEAPGPRIVDLGHGIAPGDIRGACWLLTRVHAHFPPGTVHLAVVEPGVGTARPVVAVAAGGHLFVAPGNGLLFFLAGAADLAVVRLDDPFHHRRRVDGRVSATFHGRDIMAPAAAHLAMGVPVAQLGSGGTAADLGSLDPPPAADDRLGTVVWVDRFGNAITDIDLGAAAAAGWEGGSLIVAGTAVAGPCETFGLSPPGQPFWYWGSGGTIELALRDASAAARFGWRPGLAVVRAAP